MSTLAGTGLPRHAVQAKALSLVAGAALMLGVFLQGFVMNEPAPYELFMSGLIAVWGVIALRISRLVALLLALMVLFNLGGLLSMLQMGDLYETPLYLAVSLFLAFTAVFFAAILEADSERYALIFNALTAAALVTGMLGIAGYFGLFPGAEMFTRFDRAMGAFGDPNVFGPFLTLPAIFMLHRLLTANSVRVPLYAGAFIILTAAIFLSFSRGAWGLFGFSAIALTLCLYLQSASNLLRLRLTILSVLAMVLLSGAILVALQMPGVSDFFSQRARLIQDYDGGHLGRFARYAVGLQLATEHPLGIGPLNFGRLYGEDTHNIWLKALMDYGWLGFAAFALIVGATLAGGLRILFRDRPWQPYLLCAYIVFAGHIALGTVIDMDHWRHFYLLIGLVWGAMALEIKQQRQL